MGALIGIQIESVEFENCHVAVVVAFAAHFEEVDEVLKLRNLE